MPLQFRALGHQGFRVSSLAMGCVTFGREIDYDSAHRILSHATERGINLLDTAATYGDGASERAIGQWLAQRASTNPVHVATKVSGKLTRQNIELSIEASLGRLGIDCVDLLQAHEWDAHTPIEESLGAFDRVVRAGKARTIGWSNLTSQQLADLLWLGQSRDWPRITAIQPRYSLADRQIERDLLPMCKNMGVGVISYSPLAAGFLTGKYQRGQPIPAGARFDIKPGHQRIYFTDHAFAVVERLRALSQRIGEPMERLALAWITRRPAVTSVLIGARSTHQVDQAFDALDFEYTSALDAELNRLSEPTDDHP